MAVHCDVCGTRIFNAFENDGSFQTEDKSNRVSNSCEDCGKELRAAVSKAVEAIRMRKPT
jgi:hypothetical protein